MSPSSPVQVLASSALPEGGRVVVKVGGLEVALVRKDGAVHAIGNLCPHRGGSLGHGDLEGFHLYCPLHAWCFDVRTGEAFFPQGAKVPRYVAQEADGHIWVLLEGPPS